MSKEEGEKEQAEDDNHAQFSLDPHLISGMDFFSRSDFLFTIAFRYVGVVGNLWKRCISSPFLCPPPRTHEKKNTQIKSHVKEKK